MTPMGLYARTEGESGRVLPARHLGEIEAAEFRRVIAVHYGNGEILYYADDDGRLYDVRSRMPAYLKLVTA